MHDTNVKIAVSKWALQSRTVIGVLLATLVSLAPLLGLSFTENDAALVNETVDAILTAIFAAFALYGRFKATTAITALPKKDTTTRSPFFVVVLALLAVSVIPACSANLSRLSPDELAKLNPQARYYQMMSEYSILVAAAADYSEQPFCDSLVVIACSEPRVVIALETSAETAFTALEVVRPLVTRGEDDDRTMVALQTASAALSALSILMVTHSVKGATR